MGKIEETQMMKEMDSYTRENPEWVAKAREVLNTWSAGERMLVIAVAMGLREAYLKGKKGRHSSGGDSTKRVSRSSKATTTEKTTARPPRVVRKPRSA